MYRENKNMNHDAHQTILRGDLYYADLSPVVGSEQGGVRPVLVIQNDVGNKYSPTVIVAAITSRSTKAAIPTHVCIRRMRSGLKQDSTVLAEQIRTIDRDRLKEYIGHLDSGQMAGIEQAMVTSLGLGHLTGNMGQVFFPSMSRMVSYSSSVSSTALSISWFKGPKVSMVGTEQILLALYGRAICPVSYTHLTLPTNSLV